VTLFLGAGAVTAGVWSLVHTAEHNDGVTHPPTPSFVGTMSAPRTPGQTITPASSSSNAPETSSPPELSLGIPLSFTLRSRKGGVQSARLRPMPKPHCYETLTQAKAAVTPENPSLCYYLNTKHTSVSMQWVPPETQAGWRTVYYVRDDPRLILAHTTEIPANADFFAGQPWGKIRPGDELSVRTTTGTFREVAKEVAVASKATSGYNDMAHNLGRYDFLFATCNFPNDSYNNLIEFVPVGPPTPTSIPKVITSSN